MPNLSMVSKLRISTKVTAITVVQYINKNIFGRNMNNLKRQQALFKMHNGFNIMKTNKLQQAKKGLFLQSPLILLIFSLSMQSLVAQQAEVKLFAHRGGAY